MSAWSRPTPPRHVRRRLSCRRRASRVSGCLPNHLSKARGPARSHCPEHRQRICVWQTDATCRKETGLVLRAEGLLAPFSSTSVAAWPEVWILELSQPLRRKLENAHPGRNLPVPPCGSTGASRLMRIMSLPGFPGAPSIARRQDHRVSTPGSRLDRTSSWPSVKKPPCLWIVRSTPRLPGLSPAPRQWAPSVHAGRARYDETSIGFRSSPPPWCSGSAFFLISGWVTYLALRRKPLRSRASSAWLHVRRPWSHDQRHAERRCEPATCMDGPAGNAVPLSLRPLFLALRQRLA